MKRTGFQFRYERSSPYFHERLNSPGGPRFSRVDLLNSFKTKKPSQMLFLGKGHRFVLNLKLTHTVVSRLLDVKDTSNKLIIELGPGPGTLTRSLLTRPCLGLLGIELDPRYNAYLEAIQQDTKHKFRWTNGNVLELAGRLPDVVRELFPEVMTNEVQPVWWQHEQKLKEVGEENGVEPNLMESPFVVIANLPFETAGDFVRQCEVLLGKREGIYAYGPTAVHVFLDQSVAERFIASPGTPSFSRSTILCQNYYHISLERVLSDESFFPLPRREPITAAILSLTPRAVPLVDVPAPVLRAFTKILLRHRAPHQTVRKGLQFCFPPELVDYTCTEVGIDPGIAPFQLSVTHVAKMALMWYRFLEATNQSLELKQIQTDEDKDESNRRSKPTVLDEQLALESGVLHDPSCVLVPRNT